jgi:hypothetical protein
LDIHFDMDPVMVKLAKKKGPVFQCTVDQCREFGDKLSMERHFLKTHVEKNGVPFRCSECDFVATKEKDVMKHDKWYKPHKMLQVPEFKVIKGEGKAVIDLKRWENAASLTHWLGQMRTTEKKEPAVEDITEQLLTDVDVDEFSQDDGSLEEQEVKGKPAEELEAALVAKEKALDAKMEKIDEVFRMVSEIYRNGPMRGLTPIPNREPTPPLKARSRSRSPPRRSSQQELRQRRADRLHRERVHERVRRQREERWRRANTLFRDGERHRTAIVPKLKSVVKVIRK